MRDGRCVLYVARRCVIIAHALSTAFSFDVRRDRHLRQGHFASTSQLFQLEDAALPVNNSTEKVCNVVISRYRQSGGGVMLARHFSLFNGNDMDTSGH